MKTIIVSGGSINEIFVKQYLSKNNYDRIIAVDKGLEILDGLKITPNYIVGDFDSVDISILNKYKNIENVIINKYNPEKDCTDTHLAVKCAMKLESDEIIILGGIGTRLDHTLANIHILKEALKNGKSKIVNENNEIQLIDKSIKIEKNNEYKYISLVPLTTIVNGVTIKGAKYALENYKLEIGKSIGISNEQTEKYIEISIKTGILIVIQSKD